MNLITDRWIPVVRASGQTDVISPAQIAERDDPPMRIDWPRADLRMAGCEFLIGLMSLALNPTSKDDWIELNEEPASMATLEAKLAPFVYAFNLDGDGPRFMQDFGGFEAEETMNPLNLFLDAPGESTVKKNTDWFSRRPASSAVLSRSTAAITLYAFQSYAGQGGRGYHKCFRGGAPLTTVVIPHNDATLYEIVCANVTYGRPVDLGKLDEVLPWLAPVRPISVEKTHPLQAYFGMPRRIRLHFEPGNGRTCAITGCSDDVVVTGYLRATYGLIYSAVKLRHPLSPYRIPKKDKPPYVMAAEMNARWSQFLGLVASSEFAEPSRAVEVYRELAEDSRRSRIMASGFVMDGASVTGFSETEMPLPMLRNAADRAIFDATLRTAVSVADITAKRMRSHIASALKSQHGKAKAADQSVLANAEDEFWLISAPDFRALVDVTWLAATETHAPPLNWAEEWRGSLARAALRVFDGAAGVDLINPRMRIENGKTFFPFVRQRGMLSGFLHGRAISKALGLKNR